MDRRERIEENSSFYIVAYRKLINFTYFMLIIVLLAMGWIIYQYQKLPNPTYFITTVDGRLIEIKPTAP